MCKLTKPQRGAILFAWASVQPMQTFMHI